mmetsp:Transcript_9729/g.22717  ORF Transcript_9729/g.22717 Transcript_9729/m.22717 type:complete len:295 (+) Transcript_9729:745-1629(+)
MPNHSASSISVAPSSSNKLPSASRALKVAAAAATTSCTREARSACRSEPPCVSARASATCACTEPGLRLCSARASTARMPRSRSAPSLGRCASRRRICATRIAIDCAPPSLPPTAPRPSKPSSTLAPSVACGGSASESTDCSRLLARTTSAPLPRSLTSCSGECSSSMLVESELIGFAAATPASSTSAAASSSSSPSARTSSSVSTRQGRTRSSEKLRCADLWPGGKCRTSITVGNDAPSATLASARARSFCNTCIVSGSSARVRSLSGSACTTSSGRRAGSSPPAAGPCAPAW